MSQATIALDPERTAGAEAASGRPNLRDRARASFTSISGFIEEQIRTGAWAPGTQLPTERALVERFGAARNTVRRSLKRLEDLGLVERQVGRGTFVIEGAPQTALGADFGLSSIAGFSPADVMECRTLFEPGLAELVVARARPTDLERLRMILREGDAAQDLAGFERWDEELHTAIAEATRNPVVIAINTTLALVRRKALWGKLKERAMTPERKDRLRAEHAGIVAAIEQRDGEAFRARMRDHLVHVTGSMFMS